MARQSAAAPRIAPKKSLGQNFLNDPGYLRQIVEAAELTPADRVLEVGPGQGALTRELAAQAGGVVAVELDDRLITPLRALFATKTHVKIVHGDILELDPTALIAELPPLAGTVSTGDSSVYSRGDGPAYKVVANLPYYITSAVLRHLLEASQPPSRAVLLVQLEVAQRICAAPGDLSLLAVSVQYYATPTLIARVPAGAFRPVPKVDSAILRLDVHSQPPVGTPPEPFFTVVRAGFGQKRKQLLNSLSAGLARPKTQVHAALACAGIDPMRRAETLGLTEWDALCRCLDGQDPHQSG